MTTQLDYKVIETMEKYGGSFVQALARCFRRADTNNFRTLREAFAEYWEQYRKMSGYIECSACKGDGWTDEHDTSPKGHNGDGECQTCPIHVQCIICEGAGIMEVAEVLGKTNH